MLKSYKSLLLIAISISCSYSMEEQKLQNNIIFKTTLYNSQQLLQQTEYNNNKNMNYDEQICRKEIIDKFIFTQEELSILSQYLLSTDKDTNKTVINHIKGNIIPKRNREKSKTSTNKLLTTVYNISKGNFYIQSEQEDIENIELDEEQHNKELSNTQKKNISFVYANYLLRYFFNKSNKLFETHDKSNLKTQLLLLYEQEQNVHNFLCNNCILKNINEKATPFNIIVEKIKTICGNNTNKLDILLTQIIKEYNKGYQIDENNNILYRLSKIKYQTDSPVYILYKFSSGNISCNSIVNNSINKKEKMNCYRTAFKEIAKQYRSDKSISDKNNFTDNKLKEYIEKIEDVSLKQYANNMLVNVAHETIIGYIKDYSDALDKYTQQNKTNICAVMKQNQEIISPDEEKRNENIMLLDKNAEKDMLKNETIQDNTQIIISSEKDEKQNKNTTLLNEKCSTNNIEFNNNLNNCDEESIISYDENNRNHISIGNKKKKDNCNEIKDSKINSYQYNNPMLNNIDKSLNTPAQMYSNDQVLSNNLFPFNNNINTFFGYTQPYNHFTQLLGNIHNNSFIPYQLQNNIQALNQNSNIPYKNFTQELNNNINSIISNNNFVPYQVPNKIIISNQDYNASSNIQYNNFKQKINNNTNSIIYNNNFIPYQNTTD